MASKNKTTSRYPKPLLGIRNKDLYNKDNYYEGFNASEFSRKMAERAYANSKGLAGQLFAATPASFEELVIPWGSPAALLGLSRYDDKVVFGGIDNLRVQDDRAANLPWYAQLGAGIAKGVITAGTTFLDGTVGLLVGAGSAIANKSWGKLFNNDFSLAMRLFTNAMEEELPNYRSVDEQENPMAWRNLFTMNTFADDFLKNLGFGIGAFYSGNAFLGALKAIPKIGTAMSKVAMETIGSVVSGFNEGRIEAGNLYDETVKEETLKLTDARQRANDEILKLIDELQLVPDLLARAEDGSLYSPKLERLKELRLQQANLSLNYDKEVKDILARAEKAAVADMALNTLYLPLTYMYAYGKLFSRGFKVKKDLAGKVTKGLTKTAEEGGEKAVKKEIKEKAIDIAARQEAEKQALGDRIKKGAKEYITNPVTRKKATIRGLKTGLSEGAEEINQSMFSSYAGASYSPDSPDAYYQALTNEDYQIKTKDQLTALTEAMMDSWGNPSTYKEGLVGFMTGILGMPTFGRVQNSDENTYLGKSKMIGLSGGLFGELSRANRLNREAEVAASAMNKLVKRTDDIERFFVRSLSFTDPMEGYSKEGNKFEFENASDNDLFNAIDAFARTGRLSDLRDLVGESFGDIDNLSVEDLKDIAEKTKGDTNEWNNPDGTSMADKPETRPKMKKILKDKLQKILNAIDSYEDSLEKVRTISNNSLDTDLVAELAWLDWKTKLFGERYKGIKSQNEDLFKNMSNALLDYRDELTDGIDTNVSDEEIKEDIDRLSRLLENSNLSEEEKKDIREERDMLTMALNARVELSNANTLIDFISKLQKAKTPLALSAAIASLPGIVDYLLGKEGQTPRQAYDSFNGKLGITFDLYKLAMDELADSAKLAVATRDFNERFKEFSSDPIKLIDNRRKIDEKNSKNNKAKDKAKGIDRLNNMSTSEIAEGLRNGEIDAEAAEKAIEGIDLNSLEDRGEPNVALKLDLAKKINQTYENAVAAIEDLLLEGTIDELVATDTLNALELLLSIVESVEELLDSLGEAFLDPENIDISDLENMDLDAVEEEIARRQAAALNLINQISLDALDAAEAMADGPTPEDLEGMDDIESALDGNTGHDSVDKAKSENHRKEDKKNNPPKVNPTVRTSFLVATAVVEHNEIIPEQKLGITNILTKIGEGIDSLLKNGVDEKTIAEAVKSWNSYTMLQSLLGDNDTAKLLNDYVILRRKYPVEGSSLKQEDKAKTLLQKAEIEAPTPEITQEDVEKLIRVESRRDLTLGAANDPSPIYNYWKPTITELPIHRERGSNTPYWELAKTMKKEGTNDPLYTDSELTRMEAVGKYLQRNGAFSRVNSGKVLEGDKIIYFTDKTLNEEAGEMVILMAIEDNNGGIHVVGDLPSKNDYTALKQSGLPTYIEECEKYLAADKSNNNIVILPGETTVRQNMVGKVMYTPKNETHTLNEIHGDLDFKLGIAVTDGRMPIIRMKPGGTRVLGQTEEESRIISPLDSTVGQPFLLMPTSSPKRSYVCVPFFMPKYSELTKDSSLGKAITNILLLISSGSTDADSVRIKNELGELISVAKSEKGFPEIHINYNGDNVKVTIKPLGSDHLITLYNGNKNNDKMVENIQSKLYGVPFQINRKYINKDYKGLDYNRMVGELALTNVAVGETHTRSDWFTVNPLGANMEKLKGSKIKSTKLNPKAVTPASASGATPTSIPVTTKAGNTFYVDPSDWSVYYNGKQFTGNKPGVNKARAIAFGKLNNEDMTKPYDTQWGYYNPVTGEFELRPDNSQPLEDNIVQFPFDSNLYSVNTDTWLVLDLDNKKYSGPSLNIIRALVYGKIHELLMDKPYETPWGVFDPTNNQFVENKIEDTNVAENKKEVKPQEATRNTPQELKDKAKKAGLLNNKNRKALWEVLTTELKLKLVDAFGPKLRQLILALDLAFDASSNTFNEDALGGSVDLLLNKKALFSKVGSRDFGKKWNQKKELAKMLKMLPQFRKDDLIIILKGLIRIADSQNPGLAYGMFQRGVITISDVAASGTMYHEAFHAVFNSLMSVNEREKIMEAAASLYGNDKTYLVLEENLAEDFRKYVLMREAQEDEMREKYAGRSLLGKIMRFFRKLKHLCGMLRGREPYINKVFKDIYNGRYARRKVLRYSLEIRYMNELYTPEMRDILRNAPRDSQGRLLAPNGKPSNLTERQYAHVRTKAFKEWFGDWEKYAKLNNATVIWGHPASGKTYLFKQGRKDIIDFDSEYKVRINKIMGLPEGANAKELRKAARNARKQEYHDLIMQLFDEAKAEAKRTGKKLLVSDMMLLREREADIDVITNMSDEKFIERSAMRGETDADNKMLWKNDINDAMGKASDKSKIINTEEFILDDLYGTNVSKVIDENGEPLVVYSGRPTKNTTIFNLDSKRNRTQLTSLLKKGVYFTKDKNVADLYKGSKIYNNELDRELIKYGAGEDGSIFLNKSAFLRNHPNITSEHYDKLLDRYNSNINDLNNPTGEFIPDVTYNAGETIAAFLNIRNPYVVNLNGRSIAHLSSTDIEDINNSSGAIINNVDEHTSNYPTPTITTDYIVFNPNQIKSATDNVGTYSRENNDIRYRGVESNSLPWYLAEHVLTESEYNDMLWEMNLSEDKFSSFIHNFVKNILLVNPKLKLNKENNISFIREKLRVGNVVSKDDMQKVNSFTYRLLGYYPYLPTEEVSRNEYKEIITNELNNWELNLIDAINNPPLEWNVLQRRNVVNELLDEVNKLRSQLRKETNPKERSKLGFKIHNNYRKLVEALNELRAAEIRNNTKILASKNRLVALKLIPNIKLIALERIMREYDSRNLSEEQYNNLIESIRPLYNSLLSADRISRNSIEAVLPYANSEHKEITFNEVEAKILESNPEFKELLQLIKKINPNVKIIVGADEYIKNLEGLGASAAGGYSPSNNTIYYRRSADVYTYIHELTHSATIYGIYNVDSEDKRGFKENEFYQSITNFMDYVRDYIRKKGLDADLYTIHARGMLGLGGPLIYGFTNAGEFLAEVFANTGLLQLLENIPAMQPKKFKSLLHQIWDSIINFFSNITGINRKNVTALDLAKKLGYAAMSLTLQRINTVLEQLKELDKNNIEEETHKDVRYNRAEVIEGLEYKNLELNRLAKEINRLMKIAKDNALNWHTINKEKWAYLSTAGYLSEDAAEDAIPDDMKLVAEVREQYGRYYIKYNTDRVLAKIRALHSEIRWNSWYITNLKQRETPFLLDNELSERMLEEQLEREDRQDYLADIAEIRQYHSDKLMYENLSQEDKDYIAQRKITLDEYNRMSDIEKRTLFECKA